MEGVVCPHCDIHVTVSGDSVSHTCPYCKGEFQLEDEYSEFERELNLIDLSSENKNKTEKSNNAHTNNRKGSLSQQVVGERFEREIGTIRLTKFSPLSLFRSIFILTIIIMFPVFLVFGIKEEFREYRRIHLFLHSSSNIVELTGHRKYGLGHHEVMYRTNLTSETIVEPFTEITAYDGESGGTSYRYGLLFEGTEGSWTFYSSQREVKSVLSEIESRCNVMVLPHRGEQ